jgi:predicted nucleic acid-binding Zn ribbon protein
MPVLADDFLGSHGSESRALSSPHVQNSGAPMTETSLTTQVPPEAARALVGGAPANVDDRRCPVCGTSLRPRQRVCSGRCRAELSRHHLAEARQARDEQVRALLLAALALLGKNEQP